MSDLRRFLRTRSYMVALVVTIALLIANVIALPHFGNPSTWKATLAVFAPFVLAAMAGTPAIVSGGGGIDISIGPLMGLVNIVLVAHLIPGPLEHPVFSVPIVLALGAAVGAANGVLVAVLRYEPVIATLCALFILAGVNLKLAPRPISAEDSWTKDLGGSLGPIPGALVTILVPVALWLLLRRTSYRRNLYLVGGNDATAYSAGVNVAAVRVIAYTLGGLFAAIGGIALTALIQSADATTSMQYILIGLAAVALGGTPIGLGGRGGLLGSFLGAAALYLVTNLLATLHVDALWVNFVYGAMLVGAAILGAALTAPPRAPRPRSAPA